MKKTQISNPQSFLNKNKEILVIGGAFVLVTGSALLWYYYQKRKKEKKQTIALKANPIQIKGLTPPFIPLNIKKSKSSYNKYIVKYGSRNGQVKILQKYLKVQKADLGRSGINKDGVDGIFGRKTLNAAKKNLQKTAFTTADIEGMKKALKSLRKL